jgi:hypothetical protein
MWRNSQLGGQRRISVQNIGLRKSMFPFNFQLQSESGKHINYSIIINQEAIRFNSPSELTAQ